MEKIKLSKRLNQVAKYVLKNKSVLDVGSDHAYLPIYLIQNNIIPFAIAGEVVKGPYEEAVEQVALFELEDKISTRFGDGLNVIEEEDEIGTITICGMGGSLIASILEEGLQNNKLPKTARLVLQPNNGEKILRTFLETNNYQIIDEYVIEENSKIYEIIVAETSETNFSYTTDELLFGPILLKEKSEVFTQKWNSELEKYQSIFEQLQKSSNQNKNLEIKEMIQTIKQVIS